MRFNRAGGGTEDVLARDLPGRFVRTVAPTRTGEVELPAGTVLEVDYSTQGRVHLRGAPCPACGVTARVRRVPRRCVEILPRTADGPLSDPGLLAEIEARWPRREG